MLVHPGHRRLACLPCLRLIRQLGLLGGQCQCLRFEARLRVRPFLLPLRLLCLRRLARLRFGLRPLRELGFQLPPQRRQLARLGLDAFPALGLLRQLGPRLRQRLGQRLHALFESVAMLVDPGHLRLACMPCLRLVRQLGLLGGQCQCLRFEARLRVGPLLLQLRLLSLRRLARLRFGLRPLRQLGFQSPPQRRQLARLGLGHLGLGHCLIARPAGFHQLGGHPFPFLGLDANAYLSCFLIPLPLLRLARIGIQLFLQAS